MQILDVGNLKSGRTFPQPLFHSSGRKLLSAGTQLSQMHIQAILRSGIKQIFVAENARAVLEFANTPASMIPVASLIVGSTAETDLLTLDGIVIIQQNEQVEDHHLAALRDSHIDFLIARPAADMEAIRATLDALSRVVISRMEAIVKRGEYVHAPEARDPFIATLSRPAAVEVLNLNAAQTLRKRLTHRLQPIYGMLETGNQPSHHTLLEITNELLEFMRSEPRQFSQLALMTTRRDDYLPDHAISVAVLSMAIAAHMKLSLELIKEIILGALLFDVGMLAIPKRIRSSSGPLTPADRMRVQQHPIYSLSMLEYLPGLSPIARLMGLQHHERLNGTGYPTTAATDGISDFSRIIAAADIFAASTNPRAYKSQKLPYSAVAELIHMAHNGLLDPRIVKALLAAIGLFPVGSYVLLSNNMNAQIVGTNSAKIDRPLVRAILPGESLNAAPLIDLAASQYSHIKISRAIPVPTATAEAAAIAV